MKKKNMELGIKISALKESDVEEINRFLKMDECDFRITKTDMKKAKDGLETIKGWLK